MFEQFPRLLAAQKILQIMVNQGNLNMSSKGKRKSMKLVQVLPSDELKLTSS